MLCAWCPGAACHAQDPGPGQRHKSCRASLFWERCRLCLQSAVFRWATERTLPSSTGTEGQRSGLLPPPILHLSGFPQDTLLPGGGGCCRGVRLPGLATNTVPLGSHRNAAFQKKPLLKYWSTKQKSSFPRLRCPVILHTKRCPLTQLLTVISVYLSCTLSMF